MSDIYEDVYVETTSGVVQGPFETIFKPGATEVWIYDESALLEEGFSLLKGSAQGGARYVITSVRETRPQGHDGRIGALRRCLSIQLESGDITDGLKRLIRKIDTAKVDATIKNEAKTVLTTSLRNPLIAAILNGDAPGLIQQLEE